VIKHILFDAGMLVVLVFFVPVMFVTIFILAVIGELWSLLADYRI
jgi:hypothetical protein